MFEIEEITTIDGFHSLKEKWNNLLSRSTADNIFLTWEWQYNWWTVFGEPHKLMILVIKKNAHLMGIAPFFIRRCRIKKTRVLQFIGSFGVGSDYLDFLIEAGREEDLIYEYLKYLQAEKRRWDIVNITNIYQGSRTVEILAKQDMFLKTNGRHTPCPYLKLTSTWTELHKGFSKNMRYNLNRKRRKFETKYNGKFISVTEAGGIEKAIKDMIGLNKSRFKIKEIESPFFNPGFDEFHRKIIPLFFNMDILRMFFLTVDGTPVACLYIFKYNKKYYYYQSGFEPCMENISPGMVIFSYAMEKAIDEGMNEFDFLQGGEEYKSRWTREVRYTIQIRLFPTSLRGLMLFGIDRIKKATERTLKKVRPIFAR